MINGMASQKCDMNHGGKASSSISTNFTAEGSKINISNNHKQDKPKVVIDWECVNPDCNVVGYNTKYSKVNEHPQVKTASKYIISFYGQGSNEHGKNEKLNKICKKRKVCFPCEKKAIEAQDKMLINLAANTSIITNKLFPTSRDVVLIEDSDEEAITDTSSDSEIEMDFIYEKNDVSSDQDDKINVEKEIQAALSKIDVKQQMKCTLNIINETLDNLQADYNETDEAFTNIEKEVDRIREMFYKPFRPIPQFLEPIDLNLTETSQEQQQNLSYQNNLNQYEHLDRESTSRSSASHFSTLQAVASLPPTGNLERPELKLNENVYAVRGNILTAWKKASVVEIVPGVDVKYKLRLESLKDGQCISSQFKLLSAKFLAYSYAASVRLPVGIRIIAIYNDHQQNDRSESPQQGGEYYSGIIAEPPKAMNKHRYLVFFDDGYASYVKHQDIRVVCRQTESNGNGAGVWDDIHQNSREFIRKYLMQYPERPMVRLMQGQTVRTEMQGSWWYTKVETVDASLVKLIFHVDGRREYVYRGSTRLEPLYLEMQQQKKRAEQIKLNQQIATQADGGKTQNINRFMPRNRIEGYKKNRPYVEYTRQVEQESPSHDDQPVRRAVAKKSTGAKRSLPQTTETLTDKPSWDKRVSSTMTVF